MKRRRGMISSAGCGCSNYGSAHGHGGFMRRFTMCTLIISGIVLAIFGVNIVLYCYVPAYHDALESAVAGDSEIPTVVIDENKAAVVIQKNLYVNTEDADNADQELTELGTADLMEEEVPLSGNVDCEKRVVEKTYYEDCGTGNGYWIIKYEDGSTSVEQ